MRIIQVILSSIMLAALILFPFQTIDLAKQHQETKVDLSEILTKRSKGMKS